MDHLTGVGIPGPDPVRVPAAARQPLAVGAQSVKAVAQGMYAQLLVHGSPLQVQRLARCRRRNRQTV
jgi:hypothetical protein